VTGSRPAPSGEDDEDVILLPPTPDLTADAALALLRGGELELIGRLVASSNNALLGTVTIAERGGSTDGGGGRSAEGAPSAAPLVAPCVYKPIRGERPLWDFPDGTLAAREVAAYIVSAATPWAVVPPTVLREGPFGPGMVQLWIHPDELADVVALVVEGDRRLRPMALFDAVVNNADRKVGHLLPLSDGHVYGVDHGICFNEEPKLRTVLWHWRGDRLTGAELEVLRALRAELAGTLGDALAPLLTDAEIAATGERIHALIADGRFPHPDPDRPAIPWPPY
jgi:uncharacterized repeat protein (TIGR03843 family)